LVHRRADCAVAAYQDEAILTDKSLPWRPGNCTQKFIGQKLTSDAEVFPQRVFIFPQNLAAASGRKKL
jgi:hypothetical protein